METKKRISDEMRNELRKPFEKEALKPHPTKTFLTTIKAMYVVERLNDVFGVGRWAVNTEVVERTPDYVTVKGVFESLDFEVITSPQFGGHNTTGKNTEIADGFKSAVTDCLSKIASHLEIGIDVFKGDVSPPKQQSNSKYKFGDTKIETLPWVNDANINGMIKSISEGKKQDVINALVKYRWSGANKEKITKELDK